MSNEAARSFLDSIGRYVDDPADLRVKLGTVDGGYTGTGNPAVLFDGESLLGLRKYPFIGEQPRAGDRVSLVPQGSSYIIAGTIGTGLGGSSPGPYRTGTTAQRDALTGVVEGFVFWDTTTKKLSIYKGGWQVFYYEPIHVNSTSIMSTASGWTISNCQITRIAGLAHLRISVAKASPVMSTTTSGNIGNTLVATLNDSTAHPLNTHSLAPDNTGSLASAYIQTDGGIYIGAVIPGNYGIAVGESFSFSNTYITSSP